MTSKFSWTVATIALIACAVSACSGGASVQPGSVARQNPATLAAQQNGALGLALESPPPNSSYLENTWVGIHAYQKFDNFNNKYIIPASQAAADGGRYVAVWGSNSGQMVQAWETKNAGIATTYYLPAGFDADPVQFGNLGHSKSWWLTNHPDWVLYQCDKATVAMAPGSNEVPLDISNPSVVTYLENLTGGYAEQNGYSGVGLDFAEVRNPTGSGPSSRACGVWTQQHTVWVPEFSGMTDDPAWATAALKYYASWHSYLHAQSRPMSLWGNHIPGLSAPGDSQEVQLLSDFDVVNDEQGYSEYGHFSSDAYFKHTVYWAKYLQRQGKGFLPTAVWTDSSLTDAQIEYSIATYLMSKEQASALTAVPYGMYGIEFYYSAYNAAIGQPCAEMYGGPKYMSLNKFVYYRQYTGGISIVSTSGGNTYSVTLPRSSYTDAVTGATVVSPLSVPPFGAFVLLHSNGCAGSAM